MVLDSNPLIQKLAVYVKARPNATDEQLLQYLVFHNAQPREHARSLIRYFRRKRRP